MYFFIKMPNFQKFEYFSFILKIREKKKKMLFPNNKERVFIYEADKRKDYKLQNSKENERKDF